MTHAGFAILFQVALGVVSAAVAGRSRAGRAVSGVVSALALALPFAILPDERFGRFLSTMQGALVALRTVDLLRMPAPMPFRRRLWHVLALFDTRRAARVPRTLHRAALGRLAVAAPLGTGAFLLGLREAHAPGLPALLHWAGGALFLLCVFESAVALLRVVYGLLGYSLPPLHEAPHRSVTVREFWARRWNRIVSLWLRLNVYEPLRARRRLAIAATFVFSALLHAYIVFPSLGLGGAGTMLSFFLLQGGAVLLEVALRTDRWPRGWARLWTLGVLLGSSPLFIGPCWTLVGG